MSEDDKKDNVVQLFGRNEKSPDTVPAILGESLIMLLIICRPTKRRTFQIHVR